MDAGNDEMEEIASIPSDGDDYEDDEEESDEGLGDIGGRRIKNVFLLLWTKTKQRCKRLQLSSFELSNYNLKAFENREGFKFVALPNSKESKYRCSEK
jgi:hypothetical protein